MGFWGLGFCRFCCLGFGGPFRVQTTKLKMAELQVDLGSELRVL